MNSVDDGNVINVTADFHFSVSRTSPVASWLFTIEISKFPLEPRFQAKRHFSQRLAFLAPACHTVQYALVRNMKEGKKTAVAYGLRGCSGLRATVAARPTFFLHGMGICWHVAIDASSLSPSFLIVSVCSTTYRLCYATYSGNTFYGYMSRALERDPASGDYAFSSRVCPLF
jgi:hypothetical protein